MSLLTYKPGKHENGILRLFGKDKCLPAADTVPHAGPALFFCFTNRCGSNFVVDCFTKAQILKKGGEFFNAPYVAKWSEKNGITSLPEFCLDLVKKTSGENGVFGVKLGSHQLFFLVRLGIIPSVFSDPRFIFIRRRDLLGQAISATIAFQTRKFRDVHSGNGAAARYDFDAIATQIKAIAASNASFLQFFAMKGIQHHEIVYEDFAQSPDEAIAAACEWLSLPRPSTLLDEVEIRIQRNEMNREFRERFIADASARGLVDVERSTPRFLSLIGR
jgi:LPS sulfotransferase NodH